MSVDAYHVPIMKQQVIDILCADGGVYFDGTLGGCGHAMAILEHHNLNRVIACDLDDDALSNAQPLVQLYKGRLTTIKSNFKDIKQLLPVVGVDKLDGALFDLGVSSHQIDEPNRGFSYRYDARLDMRMDVSQVLDAHTIVNTYDREEIAYILRVYGEEKWASKIANLIVDVRQDMPIDTTTQLVNIIRQCIPYHLSSGHPAKKTFQALRICVNQELQGLEQALLDTIEVLRKGANLCVITFHSLEDRIVKNIFRQLCLGCICDKRLPMCVCNNKPTISVRAKVVPLEQELTSNKRARSAVLRSCTKLID